ncbi:MAG: endopeptidase La [Acidimicrobiia bacterium]|nr:endopeptidase La [Acidimicrobiia bacterium]
MRTLPLLPLPHGVVFPEMVLTVAAESDQARHAMADRTTGDELVAIPQRDGQFGTIGVVVRVEQRGQLANGIDGAVLRAIRRVRIGRGEVAPSGALHVSIDEIDAAAPSDTAHALAREYRVIAEELLDTMGNGRFASMFDGMDDPGQLADTIGWWPDLTDEQRLQLLDTVDPEARIALAVEWARAALADARVTADIRSEVNEGIERTQREAILRRQMQAIREELGETAGDDDTLTEYRRRIADGELPDAVAAAATKELDKLERTSDQSMEAGWIRTWLDTVFEIPWTTTTDDNLELVTARAQLDADHTGLGKVKERIVEFLAVRKLRADRQVDGKAGDRGSGTILTLVGPPGVGKTSLGESVARTLGRNFVRMSLGGIRDEAEIRGHRRTYVGARPGRIVRALTDAGSRNPVILLDEIDKVGADWRGDPSSALLEVLDPAQNATFRDHYLEQELDLSDVFFIATANTLDTIPAPLLDRMEIISIEGYTEDEKVAIATDHLLPSLLERNAVTADEVVVGPDTIRAVVADYTREAGVRRLEQRLDRLIRRAVSQIAHDAEVGQVQVTVDDLRPALGPTSLREDPAERTSLPGVATGLAVTGAGGDVLFVEAAAIPGDAEHGALTLTGQLGDVMKESGQIALSYLRANRHQLGIEASLDQRFHVHFPAGAVPKDGPSAGVTMTTALVSALTGRRVRPDVAMTGEVTLHGKVLPIGGVKEKVLAAHRAGISHVILPMANGDDVDDLPPHVRDAVTIHLVDTVDEVLDLALVAS